MNKFVVCEGPTRRIMQAVRMECHTHQTGPESEHLDNRGLEDVSNERYHVVPAHRQPRTHTHAHKFKTMEESDERVQAVVIPHITQPGQELSGFQLPLHPRFTLRAETPCA